MAKSHTKTYEKCLHKTDFIGDYLSNKISFEIDSCKLELLHFNKA